MGLVISNLAVDCAEPRKLASWWAEALGWQIVEDPQADPADDEVGIALPDGSATNLLFLRVPEAKSVKNRLHLDVRPPNGSDQETELARLLAIGVRPAKAARCPGSCSPTPRATSSAFCARPRRNPTRPRSDRRPARRAWSAPWGG